ncbi:MAG: hypothetical protein AB2L09_08380 [Coriobacteriia bacterium]
MDQAQVFKRNRAFSVLFFAVGVLSLLPLILAVLIGDTGSIVVYLALVVIWTTLGILYLKPYVTVTSAGLVVKIAPARPSRSLPWESIRSFDQGRNKVVLQSAEGKSVKVYLNYLTKRDREAFLALLQQRIMAPSTSGTSA